VHDKTAEDKFVSSGNGLKRIEVMYNYFVIVGPKNDPVGIKAAKMTDAAAAFAKIAAAKATFVSRGDNSGTNSKELTLWKSASITPSGSWYVSAGKGMGDVLTMTSEMQGYTLTDKATFLSLQSKLNLQILLENASNLKNQYTIIAVNPANHKGINTVGAQEFIKWMTSSKGLKMIGEYGKSKYGVDLFTVDYNANSSSSSSSSSSK
jgi:tungstate transport system substrate-binding protein